MKRKRIARSTTKTPTADRNPMASGVMSVAMVLAEAVAASVVLLPLQLAGRRMEDAARLHIPLAGC